MPIASRTFRVFVSSTFEDLKEERNALQREVFPALQKFCESHGARFQAIDLRWGVRDEAALNQQTMEICLREIERCQKTGIKPNFIVLLGDRYGWRPVRARISATEFEAVVSRIEHDSERALVERWYQLDENAVPPEYLLKPRMGEFVDRDRWRQVEGDLHRILGEAAGTTGLSGEALVPYVASATHQEVLKGLGTTEQDREHAFAFFRSPSGPGEDPDLSALKHHLEERLSDSVFRFAAGDTKELCRQVQQSLEKSIRNQCQSFESRPTYDSFECRPARDPETEAHDEFAEDRAKRFVGRQSVLAAIAGYIRDNDRRPLVLHGASGSGKSGIMAKVSTQVAEAMPGAVTIRRFIGITPESSSGLTLLRGLCEEIGRCYRGQEVTPADFNLVANVFRERLALGTVDRPLRVFIDALDQLGAQDPARRLAWLPAELPPHCRVVVSTMDVPDELRQARATGVEAMLPQEAEEALDAWFRDVRRTLQPTQRRTLSEYFGRCGLPLYLKLAFEEARRWRSFDRPEECTLGEGLAGIIDALIDRLSAESNHGPILVSRSLGYLAAGRYGLTEGEILNVLTADDDVWEDFDRRKCHDPVARQIPVIVWSRLFLDLEPYLTERVAPGGTVVTFYHRQLLERAADRFLTGDEHQLRHQKLAEYFVGQSNWLDAEKRVPNLRRVTEMVRHQVSAEMFDEAEATLKDFDFLSAKCCGGLIFDSREDYREAIVALPEAQASPHEEARRQVEAARWTKEITEYSRQWTSGEGRPPLPEVIQSVQLLSNDEVEAERRRIVESPTRLDRLWAFSVFVEQESYPLLEFGARAGFIVQHAFNHAPRGPVHEAAERALAAVETPLLTRVWSARDGYNPRSALLRRLEGHTAGVGSVSVTPDGRRAVSASNTVRVWDLETGTCLRVLEGHQNYATSVSTTPDGHRVVSAGWDRELRLWDLETGTCLRVLRGHMNSVECVSVTPDGRRAVSGGGGAYSAAHGAVEDNTVRVWDLQAGACLQVLEGHTGWVRSVAVAPDGRRAVSGSSDETVRVWDLETGACLQILKGHTNLVMGVNMTPDGRRAVSASADKTLRVWDLETGACLGVLNGHMAGVNGVSVTPDGRRAVSGSEDGAVRLWDLETGACLRIMEGYTGAVGSISMTPDSRRAASANADGTVRVWDLEKGSYSREFEGHTGVIECLGVTPDGRRAVSGSQDKTLRVWDLATGTCLWVMEGHPWTVTNLCMTPDNHGVVTAGSLDKALRLWDLDSGTCLRALEGHTGRIYSLCVTPDGRRAVSGSGWGGLSQPIRDHTVRVWDLQTGRCLRVLKGHEWPVTCISVTPDSRYAVSYSSDKTRVWDVETGACLRVIKGHGKVDRVSVMPDGRGAVSVSGMKVYIWDLRTGACLRVLTGHDLFQDVTVTPDSSHAVSLNQDNSLGVWNLETGKCLRVLRGHTQRIVSVIVTQDGHRVVSASSDCTVRMWELETGECVAFVRLPSPATAVALSPWLRRVIAGTSNGEVIQFVLRGTSWSSEGLGAVASALKASEEQPQALDHSLLHRLRAAWKRRGRRG